MNISKKSGYLSKLQNADKFTIFRTAAVSFLVAAAVIVVLFFGYVSNNKINARMLLHETAKQKVQALTLLTLKCLTLKAFQIPAFLIMAEITLLLIV